MAESQQYTLKNLGWIPEIIESMIEGFQVIDFNWKYVYLNRSVERQSKFDRNELIGKTMMEKYPGIEKTEMFRSLQKCMNERIPQAIDNEFVFPDGSSGWFVLSIQPVAEGIVILSIDITERKKLTENLQQSINVISEQKSQLEEFCNTVSHNLRGPITNILLLADYIDKCEDGDELKIFVDKLKQAGGNLNETFSLLVETLQYQHDNRLHFEKILLDDFFKNILNSLETEITKIKAQITADFSDAPHIYIPERYASEILNQLLSNSMRFRDPQRPLQIKVHTRRINGKVLLSVSDNGLGLDVAKHGNQIFRIRKTFHEHPAARGIGLFVTRKQVESMGGRIWVEGKPGEGTTFFVEFKNQLS